MHAETQNANPLSRTEHEEGHLRRDIVQFSRALAQTGFVPGTCGNVSARLTSGNILMTPMGVSKAALLTSDLVLVSTRGTVLKGDRKPTSEMELHLTIYNSRADVSAVVHAHPPISTAFACSGLALDQVLCQEAVMVLGRVPLASYATTGTCEVADHIQPLIQDCEVILMANHGAVSCGKDLNQAFQRMEVLEHTAQIHLHALQIGSPVYLTSQQIAHLERARLRYATNVIV